MRKVISTQRAKRETDLTYCFEVYFSALRANATLLRCTQPVLLESLTRGSYSPCQP